MSILDINKQLTIEALKRALDRAENMPETCFGDSTVYFSWRPAGTNQTYTESFYTGTGSPTSPPPDPTPD